MQGYLVVFNKSRKTKQWNEAHVRYVVVSPGFIRIYTQKHGPLVREFVLTERHVDVALSEHRDFYFPNMFHVTARRIVKVKHTSHRFRIASESDELMLAAYNHAERLQWGTHILNWKRRVFAPTSCDGRMDCIENYVAMIELLYQHVPSPTSTCGRRSPSSPMLF